MPSTSSPRRPLLPHRELLIRLRKHFNLTQQDLARMAKVSPTVVSALETGSLSTPTLATVNALAVALAVCPAQLLLPAGPKPTNFDLAERLSKEIQA